MTDMLPPGSQNNPDFDMFMFEIEGVPYIFRHGDYRRFRTWNPLHLMWRRKIRRVVDEYWKGEAGYCEDCGAEMDWEDEVEDD